MKSNYINKSEAREILKGVKSTQFVSVLRKKFFQEYGRLSNVIKSTDKAILLKTVNGNVWLPKSILKFEFTELGKKVDVAFLYTPKKTKEEKREENSNANSVWCDIFAKQDANGLTENGYTL